MSCGQHISIFEDSSKEFMRMFFGRVFCVRVDGKRVLL